MFNSMHIFWDLCKAKIALFSAVSAATGYALGMTRWNVEAVVLVLGVFFLACGSGALNQYQERRIDGLMERTKGRPIPSGKIGPRQAFILSLSLILFGLLVLLSTGSVIAATLGLFAVIWYNGTYTYLKRISALAMIPGALTGTIPPLIGWAGAGGSFSDPLIYALGLFFYIWQIPHFCLLLLSHDEYKKAGLPSLSGSFSKIQILRISFSWMLSLSVASISLSLFGTFSSILNYALVVVAAWMWWSGIKLFRKQGRKEQRHIFSFAFNRINIYMLMVMSLITGERILLFT